MLALNAQDIHMQQHAASKQEAIKAIAGELTQKGLVEAGYQDGMLAREAQTSTFLGSGIAIPHGTTDTRDQVKATGVQVFHFPNGVDWGEGNIAYVAIGIAAKSDEHLSILRQLTHVLSQDGVEAQLKTIRGAEEVVALLNGKATDPQALVFKPEMILTGFPATDMTTLQAVAAGLLKNHHCLDSHGVSALMASSPVHLGQGHWLLGAAEGVQKTGISLVMPACSLTHQSQPVSALWCMAANNALHLPVLETLMEWKISNQLSTCTNDSPDALIAALTQGSSLPSAPCEPATLSDAMAIDGESGLFTVTNAHGLHARPGAMLVNTAKKFSADIKVANASTQSPAVNAKSLMKVIALGVKHGHQLQFTASGTDAEEAIAALGAAIQDGLGEHA
ncbi:fused PTS fructose transporter subunit IIA/HPr protein [Salinivibrio sp. ES.052]|uniref:fused PTS fructose transporter subunit IIA/HPr protein n=1 Tax=Salinivibrio sp. ES.052 TaxID=1882823 RepID=UPI0009275F9F|nr:fused PTS fructose transporter subunit IIA/HPr protein [Salinivibrio sp. ES.052]SIN85051.1 Phosphocarrier protein HPr /PTS system D-fructose-specific IIA component (F1P-forming), Frc family [Salinivibrio sp. ES.052]